jgi:hypothetical protein
MRESEYSPGIPEAVAQPLGSEAIAPSQRANTTEVFSAADDKDARMRDALERLDGGVEKLLEDPSSYFRVMARFHRYSLTNQIMIFSQNPNATHVAGFKQWREKFDRQVKRGERGLKIFYPRFHKELNPDTGIEEEKLTGFGIGTVFDVAQTEGKALPEAPSVTEDVSTNDISTAINLKLSRYLIDQGVTMESIPINGHAQGYYSPKEKKIAIRLTSSVDPLSVGKTKTLAHESAHYFANHGADSDRHDAETVAEASAFVALNHFGLDTGDYSFTYIASWAQDRERLHTNLEDIRRVSGQIIGAVEGVGDPYEDEFGSFDAIASGPITKKIQAMEEEDSLAPDTLMDRLPWSDTPAFWRQELERARARLQEFEEKGAGALSRYDIEIAYGGDVELAVRSSSQLVRNHISYYEGKLAETPAQTKLFDSSDF